MYLLRINLCNLCPIWIIFMQWISVLWMSRWRSDKFILMLSVVSFYVGVFSCPSFVRVNEWVLIKVELLLFTELNFYCVMLNDFHANKKEDELLKRGMRHYFSSNDATSISWSGAEHIFLWINPICVWSACHGQSLGAFTLEEFYRKTR